MRRETLKNVAVSISLAGLWYFRAFRQVIFPADHGYFELDRVRWFEAAAVLICVGIFALIFFGLDIAGTRLKGKLFRIPACLMFIFLGIAAFGAVSAEVRNWFSPTAVRFVNTPGPAIVAILCLLLSYRDRFALGSIKARLSSIALILFPVTAILILQTLYQSAAGSRGGSNFAEVVRPSQPLNDSRIKTKVVWIIFDELEHAALVNHPSTVVMPEMDRLLGQAVWAENAFPPDYRTENSLPSLLTGTAIEKALPSAPDDMVLFGLDGTQKLLSQSPTVVSDISDLGGQTAIVGWYHPYTRLFGETADYTVFSPFLPRCEGIANCVPTVFRESLLTLPLSPGIFNGVGITLRPGIDLDRFQTQRNKTLRGKAVNILSNENIDFFFFHFSIPHKPFLDKNDEPAEQGYFGSLEAVDRTLGEIRKTLESSGQWDNTALVISGDHWWRTKKESDFGFLSPEERRAAAEDKRVPFIVKLPGQTQWLKYQPPFNTVVTRYLIDSIASGEVRNTDQLVFWFEKISKEEPDLVGFRPKR